MVDTVEEKEHGEMKVVLVVPKQHVKAVKTALERQGKLDRTARIVPETGAQSARYGTSTFPPQKEKELGRQVVQEKALETLGNNTTTHETQPQSPLKGPEAAYGLPENALGQTEAQSSTTIPTERRQNMCIPTTIPYLLNGNKASGDHDLQILMSNIIQDLDLHPLSQQLSLSYHTLPDTKFAPIPKNPLHKALREALDKLPQPLLAELNLESPALVHAFPEAYSIYAPMLLLPHNAFASSPWQTLLSTHSVSSPSLQPLWQHVANAMGVTHMAINSPIPLQTNPSSHTNTKDIDIENILRSPVNITPLYGAFGPLPTPRTLSHPTSTDYNAALWATTTQNGIHQTWAPLYTMFSRGNIREKTRILHLPSVAETSGAVLDMYAGIGYFAFSYRKAGLRPVVCFELNPWSVEGLRRGVERNGWTCEVVREGDLQSGWEGKVGGVDFLIFNMSNAWATALVAPLLSTLPPVRHVNLGLLPRSRDTWRDAVRLVDREGGGWIHAHENVGVVEMVERKEEIEGMFQGYVAEVDRESKEKRRKAKVEHVERVKMYAPGVVHCVFDVWIEGMEGE